MDKVKYCLMPETERASFSGRGLFKAFAVPNYLQDFTNKLQQYGAVIQNGGWFVPDNDEAMKRRSVLRLKRNESWVTKLPKTLSEF
ncbi:hypothetical protein AAH446_10165 [Erwinia sp. P6884]|uniref:hypothetical protein n=1 Tax=Erwinia sp. P6884 TaxID=3141450 RepID=UPI0031959F05